MHTKLNQEPHTLLTFSKVSLNGQSYRVQRLNNVLPFTMVIKIWELRKGKLLLEKYIIAYETNPVNYFNICYGIFSSSSLHINYWRLEWYILFLYFCKKRYWEVNKSEPVPDFLFSAKGQMYGYLYQLPFLFIVLPIICFTQLHVLYFCSYTLFFYVRNDGFITSHCKGTINN